MNITHIEKHSELRQISWFSQNADDTGKAQLPTKLSEACALQLPRGVSDKHCLWKGSPGPHQTLIQSALHNYKRLAVLVQTTSALLTPNKQ